MKKLTQFQRCCKTIKKDRNRRIYIGLDVHKRSIYLAIWYNGKIVLTFSLSSDYDPLIRTLGQIPGPISQIVYEAGPTGFGLARALAEQAATSTQLKEVAVPTIQEEHDRQIYRLRGHLVKKRKRIKQQIKSFLLQHSLPEPQGLER